MSDVENKIPKSHREDVSRAVRILKGAGCTDVFLFGSIAEGRTKGSSDIDLAVRGCSPKKFFQILGRLMLELKHPVDLVNLDKRDEFSKYLQEEGMLVHVS